MTTVASGTVSEIEVFRHNARTTHTVVRLNVDVLTHEESLIQPPPGGNCLNWVVGHRLCIYDEMLPMLGQKPVMGKGALKRYARGTPPLRDSAEAWEFRELMTAWDEAAQRIDAGLAGLTAKALDAPAPSTPNDDPGETVRSLLVLVFFHQA